MLKKDLIVTPSLGKEVKTRQGRPLTDPPPTRIGANSLVTLNRIG